MDILTYKTLFRDQSHPPYCFLVGSLFSVSSSGFTNLATVTAYCSCVDVEASMHMTRRAYYRYETVTVSAYDAQRPTSELVDRSETLRCRSESFAGGDMISGILGA